MHLSLSLVTLIMRCVCSVVFMFLLIVCPPCIRPGDPLSSYLFIICAEGLSSMIRYTECQCLFFGLRFNTACPSISHLFFEDDSIVLCKADIQQAEVIKNILQYYAVVSGQEINFQKSAVFFNKSVPLTLQNFISSVLGITTIEDYSSYLVLPCLIER